MTGYNDMNIEGGGKFLKIEGGSYVDIHILDRNPKSIKIHGGGKDRVTCVGVACASCEAGETAKQRWLTNVFDRKEKKVKIFEFGTSIARQIKSIAEMLAETQETVHDIDFRIKAEGSGLNKTYTVIQKAAADGIPDGLKLYTL